MLKKVAFRCSKPLPDFFSNLLKDRPTAKAGSLDADRKMNFLQGFPLGQYMPGNSLLDGPDPRTKFLSLVLLMIAFLTVKAFPALALGSGKQSEIMNTYFWDRSQAPPSNKKRETKSDEREKEF